MFPPLTPASRIPLPNSSSIPHLGLGVYKLRDSSCTTACLAALASGYRHIDTATLYRNAHLVRAAVADSGLDRKEVFLTTKVGGPMPRRKTPLEKQLAVEQHTNQDDEALYQSVSQSISDLAGDAQDSHVDLLLIHVPGPSRTHRQRLWKTLERLLAERRARAIGVSNYAVRHLEEMREYATTWPPSVNQIEVSPPPLIPYILTKQLMLLTLRPSFTPGANSANWSPTAGPTA